MSEPFWSPVVQPASGEGGGGGGSVEGVDGWRSGRGGGWPEACPREVGGSQLLVLSH